MKLFGARCLRIYKNDDSSHMPSKCSKACGTQRAGRGPQAIAASSQFASSSKCSFLWRSSTPSLSKCLPAGDIETDSSLESAILATKSFPLRATREWAIDHIMWRLSEICHCIMPVQLWVQPIGPSLSLCHWFSINEESTRVSYVLYLMLRNHKFILIEALENTGRLDRAVITAVWTIISSSLFTQPRRV